MSTLDAVTKLSCRDGPCLGHSLVKALCLGGKSPFSVQVHVAEAELDGARALFSGQGMEKGAVSSQMGFSPTGRERFGFRVRTEGGRPTTGRPVC